MKFLNHRGKSRYRQGSTVPVNNYTLIVLTPDSRLLTSAYCIPYSLLSFIPISIHIK